MSQTQTRRRSVEVPMPPPAWRGSGVWSAKVDEDTVKKIRKMAANGWTIAALAREYKTTWLTMSRIVKGVSWKHVQ